MFVRKIAHLLVAAALAAALPACDMSSATGSSTVSTATAPSTTSTSTSTGTAGTTATSIAFAEAGYSVAQTAGDVQVELTRSGGTNGAVSVSYATGNGSAVAGVDFAASTGMVSWASGDAAPKSITIPLSSTPAFSGTRTLQLVLSAPGGSAALGAPSTTVVTIHGSGVSTAPTPPSAGSISWSAAAYTAAQQAGTLTVSAVRAQGSAGAVTVHYATVDGAAKAGSDYTAASGTLSWAAGDTAAKSVKVAVSTAVPFVGSRAFSVMLSGPTGGALLAAPASSSATITGSGAASVVALAAPSYSILRTGGALTVTAARAAGSSDAVSVDYHTADGTAKAGADYTAVSGTLTWAAGDMAVKSFRVPVNSAATFSGALAFAVGLSTPTGATLGSPNAATVTITAPAPGAIALSSTNYSVGQAGGTLSVVALRTGGSGGAVSVHYATADGTAKAGTDYAVAAGTLTWADGDAAAKSFAVTITNGAAYSGTRTFALALSAPSGGASLGATAAATATITGTGTPTAACAKSSSSWTTSDYFASKNYGNYVVNNNNWGNLPGQQFWSNSQDCWGVTTTSTVDTGTIRSYPSVTRGWTQNDSVMQLLSTPGTNDWTTKSGMGIAVTQLTKAKIHWAFTAPPAGSNRWLGLMDIYFHQSPTPNSSTWPPYLDLMVDQSLADQVVNSSTFYAIVAKENHASTVTLGGNQYLVYVDSPGETAYHQAAGHDIHLFQLPTANTSNNNNPAWGVADAVTDLAAIVKFFMQSNPMDDSGSPLQNSAGTVISKPLITPDLYLDAINAGWEIDTGTVYTNKSFCVSMQSEPDCP